MRLKYLIFASTMLLFSIVIVGNAWHLARLTDVTSSKLGQAAFNVSKSTVESLLAQRLDTGLIFIEQQLAKLTIATDKKSTEAHLSSTSDHQDSVELAPNRIQIDTSDFNFEQSVDLKLNDSAESRSILMITNEKAYDIPIPRTDIEESIAQASKAIIMTSIASFIFAIVFVFLISDRITRPLSQIVQASKTIGSGKFSARVPSLSRFSSSEMNELVNSINSMSIQLEVLEKERNALQEQKTTSEISEISRGLAHSIRNPLHTIQLAVETLNDNPELTQQIKRQVQRIDHHIRELMTISTHEALSSEKSDIVGLIQSIIDENKQPNRISFTHHLSAPEQRNVLMVESELRSCFCALINNALEACNEQAKKKEHNQNSYRQRVTIALGVSVQQNHQLWSIVIEDNGIGIPEAIKDKLFTPHNTNKPYGAGMGLYIAKRILVGRYSGAIEHEQLKPNGSRFIVSLTHRNK